MRKHLTGIMEIPPKNKTAISDSLMNILKGTEVLPVALTGGIATGKSTVAEFFREMGAIIIDFDLLARNVVEPGRQSWRLITDFFGNNILNPDSSINRKKLSAVVFNDPLKREKLESFTHPFIWDEFILQVEKSAFKDTMAIIIAAVPLLIEGDMQGVFSKTIIVYSSPENQIRRLMARDGIDRQMAHKILQAQMPIDDKIRYGDYIVNNDGAIKDTRKAVHDLWLRLKQIQKGKKD